MVTSEIKEILSRAFCQVSDNSPRVFSSLWARFDKTLVIR